ncbi:MAG: hypothetical protein ACRD4X_16050 [Candidatus Acidiferrales bacterium]
MRSTVSASARSFLIGFLAFGLLSLPAMGTPTPSLGMVVSTDDALISSAAAVAGVDVYPGDTLSTQGDGSLRLAAGSSQLFLMPSTDAIMLRDGSAVRANMERGTIDFSGAPGQFEVETPLGVIRGSGSSRAYGQVALLSPTKIQVSAYQGELLVAGADGVPKSIAAGETYVASMDRAGGPTDPGILGVGRPRKINWHRVAAAAVIVGGAGLAAYFVYHETTESCHRRHCDHN